MSSSSGKIAAGRRRLRGSEGCIFRVLGGLELCGLPEQEVWSFHDLDWIFTGIFTEILKDLVGFDGCCSPWKRISTVNWDSFLGGFCWNCVPVAVVHDCSNLFRVRLPFLSHRIHVCHIWWHLPSIYPKMLAYIPYMDPMGILTGLIQPTFWRFAPPWDSQKSSGLSCCFPWKRLVTG